MLNDKETSAAIVVKTTRRQHQMDGTEIRTTTDVFDIFPRHAIIPPNEEYVFTLRYKGSFQIATENAYRVVVQELPIDLKKSNSPLGNDTQQQLSIILKVVKSIYVRPAQKTSPKITIESPKLVHKLSKPQLTFVVHNEGTEHVVIEELKVRFTSVKNPEIRYTHSFLATQIPKSNILPHGKRRVQMPWPNELPKGNILAEVVSYR